MTCVIMELVQARQHPVLASGVLHATNVLTGTVLWMMPMMVLSLMARLLLELVVHVKLALTELVRQKRQITILVTTTTIVRTSTPATTERVLDSLVRIPVQREGATRLI